MYSSFVKIRQRHEYSGSTTGARAVGFRPTAQSWETACGAQFRVADGKPALGYCICSRVEHTLESRFSKFAGSVSNRECSLAVNAIREQSSFAIIECLPSKHDAPPTTKLRMPGNW